jgi:hypothetical protein
MSVEDHGGTPPSSQPSVYPHAAAEPASQAGSWLGTDFQRDLQQFTSAANSGGFFLTPEGADALLKPINEALDELKMQFDEVVMRSQHPMKLGDSEAAKRASQYIHEAQYGRGGDLNDPTCAANAIRSSIQALTDAKAAIEKSVKDTSANEQAVKDSMNRQMP